MTDLIIIDEQLAQIYQAVTNSLAAEIGDVVLGED